MDHFNSVVLPFRFENRHLYLFSSCLSLDTNCCHSGKRSEEIEQNNDQNEKEKRKQTPKRKHKIVQHHFKFIFRIINVKQ